MTSQFALPLGARGGDGGNRFFLSEANRDAAARLDLFEGWPDRAALLIGPEASGKSHLARIAVARAGGLLELVDDADRHRDDTELFHRLTRAQASGPNLLLTARAIPGDWGIALPDLRSRVDGLPVLEIHPPGEDLIGELLVKALTLRGLAVPPAVADFVVPRLERSYAAVQAAAEKLDRAALAGQRPLTVPLARAALFEEA